MRQPHSRASETRLLGQTRKPYLPLTYLLHCDVALQHTKFKFRSRRWRDPGLTTEFRVQGPEKGPSGPYVSQT